MEQWKITKCGKQKWSVLRNFHLCIEEPVLRYVFSRFYTMDLHERTFQARIWIPVSIAFCTLTERFFLLLGFPLNYNQIKSYRNASIKTHFDFRQSKNDILIFYWMFRQDVCKIVSPYFERYFKPWFPTWKRPWADSRLRFEMSLTKDILVFVLLMFLLASMLYKISRPDGCNHSSDKTPTMFSLL